MDRISVFGHAMIDLEGVDPVFAESTKWAYPA
jgi:hypothetical protein